MQDSVGALLAVAVIWLIVKFAFGTSGSRPAGAPPLVPPGAGGVAGGARRAAVPQEMVDTVHSMFPHISPEAIRYDLERSRSVEATCDRILTEGDLPRPPAGLFGAPQPPAAASQGAGAAAAAAAAGGVGAGHGAGPAAASSSSSTAPKQKPASLIARYKLEQQVRAESASKADQGGSGGATWSDSAEQRAKALQRKKEEMILEARRRMLEKQQLKEHKQA